MATFTNQATLTYNGNTATSNIVTGEITEILSATKTALSSCYYLNDCAEAYVVTLTNTGTSPITDVTVTDNLGAYTLGTLNLVPLTYDEDSVRFFVNGTLQATPTVTVTDGVAFSGITIPADSNAMLIYKASVNEFAPLSTGSAIENTVTVTGTGIVNDITATDTLNVCEEPRLEITKALTPTVVNDNGQITYTLTILNYGNSEADATDNVVITDTFTPILDNLTVTYNGTVWTQPTNYTYDTATGLFTTVDGQITVPAATVTQDTTTGAWTVTPGTSTIVITGTI